MAWGGTYASILNKLIKSLNSIIKIVLNRPRRYPTHLIYKEFQVPTITEMYYLNCLISCLRSLQKFPTVSNVHTINTRNNNSLTLYPLRVNKLIFKHSPLYVSAFLYKLVPKNLIVIRNKYVLKKSF